MMPEKNPSLATATPDLIAQWHPDKNGGLAPTQVAPGSNHKVWWKCPNGLDHEWQASPNKRTTGRGCPFCAGRRVSVTNSLATFHPELVRQWHPTKNATLTPNMVTTGSHKKVWWKCLEGPDHEWQASISNRVKGRGCPFCAGRAVSATNSLANLYPDIAAQWHPTKNGDLTPKNVASGAQTKVWWKCLEGPDHEWQAAVINRRSSPGCPYCRGLKGSVTNSLASLYPEIAIQWHPTKNGDLTPGNVSWGSSKKVWWKCPKASDHIWQEIINNRTRQGHGCPACSGRKASATNSVAELFPHLVKEWHPTKNGDLKPDQIASGSHKKVWWKCANGPDHEWFQSPGIRTGAGTGCPSCQGLQVSVTNSLESLYPQLAQEWHPTLNGDLQPSDLVAMSNKKVWWKCMKGTDHEWQAMSTTRIRSPGCPFCIGKRVSVTNSLATLHPTVAQEWHPIKNGDLTPGNIYAGSTTKYWWLCPTNPMHEWKATSHSRIRGTGCPYCNRGWSLERIRLFIQSLGEYLDKFEPAELYLIFQQSGMLDAYNKNRTFVKALTTGRIPKAEIDKFIAGEPSVADRFLEDKNTVIEEALDTIDLTEDNLDQVVDEYSLPDVTAELPLVQAKDALSALDAAVTTTADADAIGYLLASARAKLWRHALQDEAGAETQAQAFRGGEYADQARTAFLNEYRQTRELPSPDGYVFKVNGQPSPPNLMQRLAAVTVREQKRVGNWSGTGAGKTLSAVLASRVVNANLTIICCPNSVVTGWAEAILSIFPESTVHIKTFVPIWPQGGYRYLVLNYEMFQQPDSAAKTAGFLRRETPDFVVIDEIHYAKQRHESLISQRKELINALLVQSSIQNPDLHVLGMSATPVINNLQEGKSLVEMITGLAHDDLETKATVANCMKLHQKLVALGIRWLPQYNIQFEQELIEVDCSEQLNDILALGKHSHNILGLEQLLTEARLPTIRRILRQDPRPTLIYCHYITGIDHILYDALTADGWRVGFYTGEDKSGLNAFLHGDVDILIGTGAIGTGVDGLQHVCDRLIVNILPWTSAEFEQLLGRIYRQGQRSQKVQMIIPITQAHVGNEIWSWCRSKLARIQFKKSIADAAVDGIVPEGHLRTPAQAYRDLIGWLQRLEEGQVTTISRLPLTTPLSDSEQDDSVRVYRQYGDFSQMNGRWNQAQSQKTHQRLRENPQEWVHYHTLYREARKDWVVVPYEEMIKWCKARPGYVIGDFGCGEAYIAEALGDFSTVYSFDHVAVNDHVIVCDMEHVPLENEELDAAIFSLSLMGHNFTNYLREAHRVLRLDGQLHIIEATNRFKNREEFTHNLAKLGFDVISLQDMWKFTHIRAMKVDRPLIDIVSLSF